MIRPKINGKNVIRPPHPHPNPLHWIEIRLAALERDGYACRCCPNDAESGVSLELHHRHYDTWGNETLDDVITLCVLCHDAITSRVRDTTEYNIAPPERIPHADPPTVTTTRASVQEEAPSPERRESPTVTPPPVVVQPVPMTGLPPRDKPRR